MAQEVAILRQMGGLTFDAVFRESHNSDLEVTENPCETGVSISDHAYMKPQHLTLQAGVSDSVMRLRGSDQFAAAQSRCQRAYELLQQLQAAAEPFTVQTGLKLYSNMVIKSLRADQDAHSAKVLDFTAELREIIIVSTQTVKYPARKAGATKRQASAPKNAGEQQGKTVPPAKQSLLKKILG